MLRSWGMRRSRAPLAVALSAAAGLGVASACGSFGAGDPRPSSADPDARADGDAVDDSGGERPPPNDADAGADADGGLARIPPACPRPAPPSCAPAACSKRVLYAPPGPAKEYPFRLVADDGFVYWVTQVAGATPADNPYDGRGLGRILRVDRRGVAGGAQATVLATEQRYAVALTLAGAYVYWGAETEAGVRQVRRAPRACAGSCDVETVVDIPGASVVAMGTVDDATLFVLNAAGQLFRVTVAANGVGAIATTAMTGSLPGFAMTSTDGYVSAATKPEIRRLPADGAGSTLLTTLADAGASAGIAPIATDCATLWGHRGGGSIWRGPLDGGRFESQVTLSWASVFDLTTDAQYLYVGAANAGGVIAMNKATADATLIAAGNVFALTTDDQGVYWGEHGPTGTGVIHMMAKK